MKRIDLRSDTVTSPCQAMRASMHGAEVGDDVFGEDPTVNRLEAVAREMLGTEAALFTPSGTQSNLLALLSQCQRGDEYLVGQQAHTYRYEGGGAAVLGSIQPQPLEFEADGRLELTRAAAAIKPDDVHFARTRLLCLENTHNGQALPMEYLGEARAFADTHGLRLHLDGARIFNAAVRHRVEVAAIAGPFDSISVCLSKGLGAPVGSVLCAGTTLIQNARRWRKMLGGGMRQAGILAAAGIHALQHNVDRLAEDHSNAAQLARGLSPIEQLQVEYRESQTNMVFISMETEHVHPLHAFLTEQNIHIIPGTRVRLVTHLDINTEDIERVVTVIQGYFSA